MNFFKPPKPKNNKARDTQLTYFGHSATKKGVNFAVIKTRQSLSKTETDFNAKRQSAFATMMLTKSSHITPNKTTMASSIDFKSHSPAGQGRRISQTQSIFRMSKRSNSSGAGVRMDSEPGSQNSKKSITIGKNNFMLNTVSQQLKEEAALEKVTKLNKREISQERFDFDKLMRLKDSLKSRKTIQIYPNYLRPKQTRFGSIAYLIQQPKEEQKLRMEHKKGSDQGSSYVTSLHQLELDDNMRQDFSKLNKRDVNPDALDKFKWKTIGHLLETKKEQIELLTQNLRILMQEIREERRQKTEVKLIRRLSRIILEQRLDLKEVRKKTEQELQDNGLNREEFGKLLQKVGLANDQILIDKIFWIFDEDGSGDIDHKELGIGLELLKNNSFEEKLDKLFDLCDDDQSGTIDKKEFYNLLRLNVTDYEDRNKLRTYVNEIFSSVGKSQKNDSLTKDEMKEACSNNPKIKNLIEKNVKILKDIDNWIASDFAKPFETKISFCAGQSINNRNNAVYFPSINKFLEAFQEKENIFQDQERTIKKYHDVIQSIYDNAKIAKKKRQTDQIVQQLIPLVIQEETLERKTPILQRRQTIIKQRSIIRLPEHPSYFSQGTETEYDRTPMHGGTGISDSNFIMPQVIINQIQE